MDEENVYFARYSGELTADDRAALERAGFKVYENGYGVSATFIAWSEDPRPEMTVYQVVRLTAASLEGARQQVVSALGREPEDLRLAPGAS